MLAHYFRYFWNAKDEHSVHSPFVFDTYVNVIKDREEKYYAYNAIEELRKQLLASSEAIQVNDMGAGSKKDKNTQNNPRKSRKVAEIAKMAAKKPRLAQMLFRLVNRFQPTIIFDLGTSLGLTTSYLAAANPKAQVFSFEADSEILKTAKENFEHLEIRNIEVTEGNLDETLATKVDQVEHIDFAFLDANHRYEPTINYFEHISKKLHEDSVVVVDDIYWSGEMQKAWQEISQRPEVMLSIDLFWVGILFFRKKQPKQHFLLKF